MTELQQKMIDSLQLRGLAERTQEAYIGAVRQLAEHYRKSPDLITEEELRQYFLYLKNVKNYSRASSTIAICGIKFFFQHTLNRDLSVLDFVRAPREDTTSETGGASNPAYNSVVPFAPMISSTKSVESQITASLCSD